MNYENKSTFEKKEDLSISFDFGTFIHLAFMKGFRTNKVFIKSTTKEIKRRVSYKEFILLKDKLIFI